MDMQVCLQFGAILRNLATGADVFQPALLQRTSSLLSAAVGGYGVFCVVYSFSSPEVAAQALVLLGSACALSYFGRQ
jgi:hypothetical protein